MRFVDWYIGLGWKEKMVVAVASAVIVFLASFLTAMAVLPFFQAGNVDEEPRKRAQGTAPPTAATASADATSSEPVIEVKITEARWKGEKAVVEGSWTSDVELSSVHCDLLEGGTSGKSVRWWDRSAGTDTDWPARTFTQEFVAAEGGGGSLDEKSRYFVVCRGQFSDGWQTGNEAAVEGTPPG